MNSNTWFAFGFFALCPALPLPAETASSVSFVYDVDDRTAMPGSGPCDQTFQFSFDPCVQGWTTFEIPGVGFDNDGDGRIDDVTTVNVGPIYNEVDDAVAWQIHDQRAEGTADRPMYSQALSTADYQALFDEGWEFEFTVRTGATREITNTSVPGAVIRGGFVGWTVRGADDPGWGLSEAGVPAGRVGFWVGNDSETQPDGERTQKFWLEDPSLTRTVLGEGSADEFHTIRCEGQPGTSLYDWFLDGEFMGTLDFLDSPLDSGAVVRFGAGLSSPRGGAVDWRHVRLASCPPPPPATPAEQATVFGDIAMDGSRMWFRFASTFPPGTDYQPQYSPTLEADWEDIPDATVTFIEESGGRRIFEVMAPQFGTERGFYRVISASQSDPEAPIADTLDSPAPVSEEQLLLFTAQGGGADDGSTYYEGQLLGYLDEGPEQGFQTRLRADLGGGTSSQENDDMRDHIVADLDGSGLPRPIFCWPNEIGELQLVIRSVPQSGTEWPDEMIVRTLPGSLASTASNGVIRLATAQLDDDADPELVVAWTGRTGLVHLMPVDFNGDYQAEPTFGDEDNSSLLFAGDAGFDFIVDLDLVTGNFVQDEEGHDEAAIVFTANPVIGSDDYTVVARVFSADTTGFTLAEAFSIFGEDLSTGGEGRYSLNLVATAADIDCDSRDELFVGSRESFPGGLTTPYSLYGIRLPTGDGDVVIGPRFRYANSPAIGKGIALETVNLDEDKAEELLFAGLAEHFLKVRADLSFEELGRSGAAPAASLFERRSLSLVDLEFDGLPGNQLAGTPLVVIAHRGIFGAPSDERVLSILTYAIVRNGSELDLVEVSEKEISSGNADDQSVAAAVLAAPFSPLDIKLGVPRRFTRLVSNRPTVVLNAPPVHFDILDGVEYDVNGIFPTADCPPQGCPSISTYTRSSTETVTVETQWKRSWAVAAEVSGGASIGPVGVEASVRSSAGEDLDDFASEFESTTVSTEINAVDDDRIYATTLSYDIWEYPILLEDEVIGHVVVTDPSVTRDRWFGGKSIVAQNYRPYHEVGNLMSYRNTIPDENSGEFIRPPESGDTFNVSGAAGDQLWKLTRTTGETTRESRTFNFSVGATASFSAPIPFVPDVTVSGDYSSSNLASSESNLEDSEGLQVRLGSVDGSIAGTEYAITPYIYWDTSGAVVLDYAVEPFPGTPSQPTFWGENYDGKPDPAFVLPLRYDPEKGLALTEDRLRRRTRDIITLPLAPRPGEPATVNARLSNFSYKGVDDPLRVDFYLGEPGNGGQLIHSETVSAGNLEAQGKHLIEFDWTVPGGLSGASFEIHAVIDPDNQIDDEIHETNNRGWNEIFLRLEP